MTDHIAAEQALHAEMKRLTQATPEVSRAFNTLVKTVNESGALDHKAKELIALGIAVAIRCEGCLLFHARALVKLGCTRAEFADALAVAVEMGGGPARVYSAHALTIYDQMAAT